MNILLLGYGFLGHTIYSMLHKDHKIKVLSNNVIDNPEKGFFLRDFKKLQSNDIAFENNDLIIHTIHTTVPANSMLNLENDIEDNVFSTINLLNIMVEKGISKIIYISSGGAIYGKPINDVVTEEHPTEPLSGYGVIKLIIEKYLNLYHNNFNIDYLTLRPSNLFGANQNLFRPQGIVGHVLNAINNNDELDIWGDGLGKKDYLYVNDLVKAIDLSISKFESLKNDTYNITSGFLYTVNDIIDIVEKALNTKVHKNFLSSKQFDIQTIQLSGEKFSKKTNFQAQYRIEDFLKNHYHEL